MNKFTLTCTDIDPFGGEHEHLNTWQMTFTASNLDNVLNQFELFLKGCGFCFDGTIDIVKETEIWNDEQEYDFKSLDDAMGYKTYNQEPPPF